MTDTRLAIEWSSTQLSMAWQCGGELHEEVMTLKRFQAELALPRLEALLSQISQPSEIRVGRGPGNYSGIRQALAWSFGYCAPGNVRLKAFSSGCAQAHRIAQTVDGPFVILGDARRGVWWGRIFSVSEDMGWQLKSPGQWTEDIQGMPVYSQEAVRFSQASFPVIEDFPSAGDLLNMSDDAEMEDPSPLYLHPPV
ncbi:hypothetical protein P3T73_14885 [Kiritimatiellota bacterium B12222]|nr:hypothetical protein P3T73_14885 [Kiritimatiellota bacterium B12222]